MTKYEIVFVPDKQNNKMETIELTVGVWIKVLIINSAFYLGQHDWCLSIVIPFLQTHPLGYNKST